MKGLLAQLFLILAGVLATAALWRAGKWAALLRPDQSQPDQDLAEDELEQAWLNSQPRDAELVFLLDERRRLLSHLREIQFDYDTGKIDGRDFAELKDRYEREAVAVLRRLDARRDGGQPGPGAQHA
jgi:hypothetical protein